MSKFTAVIEPDGDWFIGTCPEVPGANGQGATVEECRENLFAAIELILLDRREDAHCENARRENARGRQL